MLKNTATSYGSLTKFLHWFIFILVVGMLTVGFLMDDIGDNATKGQVYMLHKSLGLTVLMLMIFRLIWRFNNIAPDRPHHIPWWQDKIARLVHFSFYVFLILMPLSGWIMSTAAGKAPNFFGLITLPFPGINPNENLAHQAGDIHEIIAWILITLLVIHTAAALKHHLIDHDNILKRMLP